ncbi:glycosyltransferase family 2 protein [Sulfitobacter pontiacus]|uniref:glycosyltransferase family 2 protein n=1 Tax=Sulfitobacter pontiacus TaxID=60137 RepID=UPI0021A52A9B|nr:glycosyltransferase family 2 protein [Sulfitobacter pontiacus]UWR20822.1 glycosyltransferase family 2 protein [Sulfitobacter pontiacus]
MKKIAIVLLNWKGSEDTIECLSSLIELNDPSGYHLVVVDNDSPDNSVRRIREWADKKSLLTQVFDYDAQSEELNHVGCDGRTENVKLTLVQSNDNVGFCIGNNLGAEIAFKYGADYVLILNNDTIVGPDFSHSLQDFLKNDDGNTLYSPQVAYASKPDRIWWFGGRFSKFLSPTYVAQGEYIRSSTLPESTQWVTGCATLISRALYERLGLYDPIFFIWCEEWDLSLRATSADVPMKVIPSVKIYHKVGKSLGIVSPLTYFYSMRNMIILRKKHLPIGYRAVFNLVYLPYKLFQSVRLATVHRDVTYFWGFFDAILSVHHGGRWRRQNK